MVLLVMMSVEPDSRRAEVHARGVREKIAAIRAEAANAVDFRRTSGWTAALTRHHHTFVCSAAAGNND